MLPLNAEQAACLKRQMLLYSFLLVPQTTSRCELEQAPSFILLLIALSAQSAQVNLKKGGYVTLFYYLYE